MPKLVITCPQNDISSFRFKEEALKIGLETNMYYYHQLLRESLPEIKIATKKNETFLIPRSPYTANRVSQNFVSLLDQLFEEYSFKSILDEKLYKRSFIQYDDKFFQNFFFKKNNITTPHLISPLRINSQSLPIIAKKRIASRASSNYILMTKNEVEEFIYSNDISQYIFQKYYPLRADYRVLVLFNTILAVVKREVIIKDGNRPTVRVAEPVADFSTIIRDQCIIAAQKMGCDFCGFDIGQKENNELFFIEFNASPQFLGVERETGLNIAHKIVSTLTNES